MNTLDLIVFIPALFFLVRGFQKGIIIELFTIAGFILAIIGCLKFTYPVMVYLEPHFENKVLLSFISYAFVFILIFILIQILGRILEKTLKITQLNFTNRILGALLGLAKITLFASLFIWIAGELNFFSSETTEGSISYPFLKSFAPVVLDFTSGFIPFVGNLIAQINGFLDQVAPPSV